MLQIVDVGAVDECDADSAIFHRSHEVHSADVLGPNEETGIEILSNVKFTVISKLHGHKRACLRFVNVSHSFSLEKISADLKKKGISYSFPFRFRKVQVVTKFLLEIADK